MKKDRLTERDKYGNAYFPECFKAPCWGSGCVKENCEFMMKVCEKLAKHEDTGWIPAAERLPEEHDSIFAKYKGTPDWKPGMFEKTSEYVLVTIKYKDGTVLVDRAHTTDGGWRTETSFLGREIIAWMPFPEPYKENEK